MSVSNIKGPGVSNDGTSLALPSCVKLVTKQDEEEFKKFVSSVVSAANGNCLKLLENFIATQNVGLNDLVKKLGGS